MATGGGCVFIIGSGHLPGSTPLNLPIFLCIKECNWSKAHLENLGSTSGQVLASACIQKAPLDYRAGNNARATSRDAVQVVRSGR